MNSTDRMRNATSLGGASSIVPRATLPPQKQYRQFIPRNHSDDLSSDTLEVLHIDYGTDISGVPMAELLRRSAAVHVMIPDFYDRTILNVCRTHIELKIHWPGYKHMQFSRAIKLSYPGGEGVRCKGDLAVKVADAYDDFLKQASHYSPRDTEAQLIITPDGPFIIGNLALASLTRVDVGVFEATVEFLPSGHIHGLVVKARDAERAQQTQSTSVANQSQGRLRPAQW